MSRQDALHGTLIKYVTDLLDLHCRQVKNTKSALRKSWLKQFYSALHGEEKLQLLLETGLISAMRMIVRFEPCGSVYLSNVIIK